MENDRNVTESLNEKQYVSKCVAINAMYLKVINSLIIYRGNIGRI